jgi:zinc-ribbon domain
MFCGTCGQQVPDSARFCQNCGGQLPISPIVPPQSSAQLTQDGPAKKHSALKTAGLVVVFVFLGLFLLIIWATKPQSESQQESATRPDLSTQRSTTASTPPQKLPDPASIKAAQKILREKWAEETQKDLWRQGMEMTFQAHGTTLYVKYVPAGDAFAFQFHEGFLHDHAETLRGLGFKTVELSNGDSEWRWKLSQ